MTDLQYSLTVKIDGILDAAIERTERLPERVFLSNVRQMDPAKQSKALKDAHFPIAESLVNECWKVVIAHDSITYRINGDFTSLLKLRSAINSPEFTKTKQSRLRTLRNLGKLQPSELQAALEGHTLEFVDFDVRQLSELIASRYQGQTRTLKELTANHGKLTRDALDVLRIAGRVEKVTALKATKKTEARKGGFCIA